MNIPNIYSILKYNIYKLNNYTIVEYYESGLVYETIQFKNRLIHG